jgi:hypothetical protein
MTPEQPAEALNSCTDRRDFMVITRMKNGEPNEKFIAACITKRLDFIDWSLRTALVNGISFDDWLNGLDRIYGSSMGTEQLWREPSTDRSTRA